MVKTHLVIVYGLPIIAVFSAFINALLLTGVIFVEEWIFALGLRIESRLVCIFS